MQQDVQDESGAEEWEVVGGDSESTDNQHQAPPPFLEHPAQCSCHPCTLPLLHRLLLETTFSQAWCLALAGQEDISTLSSMVGAMFNTLQQKSKTTSEKYQVLEGRVKQDLSEVYIS